MDSGQSFGQWLKKSRRASDLTQEQLADRVGVAPDYVRKLEKDARRPSVPVAERLAEYFSVPANQIPDIVRLARLRPVAEAAAPKAILPQGQTVPRPHPPYNLPDWPTPFIGRVEQIERVCTLQLKEEVRLLTLTGPPGIGKTRLSSEVAERVLDHFPDGTYMVRLSPVSDPEQVPLAIAQALGIREVSGRPPLDVLKDYLRDKRMLLVLDNFEQVVQAGPQVAELVQACPRLEVLVSSRAPLHVYGEHEFAMPPMSMPDPQAPATLDTIARHEAVELFVQRSQAVDHRFGLTDENYSTVAEICRQLDGLPLAIELAAARIKVLTPRQLLERLTNRLKLLTTGAQDLPDRQRTLRGAIDWSYDLLEPAEKRLFARMSVFLAGGTLEAVETICVLPGEREFEAVDGIESLLDNSLLRRDDRGEDPSFWMLWTIREYAQERLEERGEAETIRRQHAAYFMALAEQAEPKLTSAKRGPWLERLDGEIHNLRAAMEWCLSDSGDKEMGLRLAGALGWFWFFHSYLTEGRRWLEAALAQAGELRHTEAGAKALNAIGRLTIRHHDFSIAESWLMESVEAWRAVGDRRGLAYALADLGVLQCIQGAPRGSSMVKNSVALFREIGDQWGLAYALDRFGDGMSSLSDFTRAADLYEESLALFRGLGDRWGIAMELHASSAAALQQKDHSTARSRLEEAISIQREVGDKWLIANSALFLGDVAQLQGDYAKATAAYKESLSIFRELGDKKGAIRLLRYLGHLAQNQADLSQATTLYGECLSLAYEIGNKTDTAWCLVGLAGVAAARKQPERAARLFGKAEAIRETADRIVHLFPEEVRTRYEHNISLVRNMLDEVTFAAAWAEGRAMPLERAIEQAMGISGHT